MCLCFRKALKAKLLVYVVWKPRLPFWSFGLESQILKTSSGVRACFLFTLYHSCMEDKPTASCPLCFSLLLRVPITKILFEQRCWEALGEHMSLCTAVWKPRTTLRGEWRGTRGKVWVRGLYWGVLGVEVVYKSILVFHDLKHFLHLQSKLN